MIANKPEVRKQFKHGIPEKLNNSIKYEQNINNSSPSYKPQNIQTRRTNKHMKILNDILLGNRLRR